MSRAWAAGSTRQWRALRRVVLARDNYRCRLQLPGCTTVADTVHHTIGKAHGDDPSLLIASCRSCNAAVGDPRAHDPAPRPRTTW